MPRRRPVLIFDFGNVVAFFDYTRACEAFGSRLGLSGEQFLKLLRDRGLDALMREYEHGRMTSDDFSEAARRLIGGGVAHEEFADAWADIFWLNEPVAELIRSLADRGYRLVLGSNTNELHAARFRRQFAAVLSHFDGLVLSHEVGHMKPAPEFYRACVAAAGVDPVDCVFIDDLPENVEGACAAGLGALRFRDAPALIEELAGLGVEVDRPPVIRPSHPAGRDAPPGKSAAGPPPI